MTRSRVVVVAILAAASIGGWRLGEARQAATAEWTVVAVLDGDTIRVERDGNADTVRLLGVNTPDRRKHHLGAQGALQSRPVRRAQRSTSGQCHMSA